MKILTLALLLLAAPLAAAQQNPCYTIEDMPVPKDITLEVGGICFTNSGALLVCTRWGEVWSVKNGKWTLFASGLHEPLGIWAERDDEVYVMQRPELTRLRDTRGAGKADSFETVCDDWFMLGLETEYTFGLARDRDGNFWSALGPNWDASPKSAYRCWSFKITPQGKAERWSCGLRNADGICVTPDNDVFLIDNQGEWTAACSLHHATKDAFHGCPWGTHSSERLKGVALTPEALDPLRKRPAVIFPYDHLARSPTQPIVDTTEGKFGPFAGQIFVGDHTNPVICRVALEQVGGEFQGACFPFVTGMNLGNHRLAFSPDGELYIGQTVRGWLGSGGEGIQKIVYSGKMLFEIHHIAARSDGFELHFTQAVNEKLAAVPATYAMRSFRYNYWSGYGSPEIDIVAEPVKSVTISEDKTCVILTLGDLKKERIYEFIMSTLASAESAPLVNKKAWYTLNRIPK